MSNVTFRGTSASNYILGDGRDVQPLFAITNDLSSHVDVAIIRLTLQNEPLQALAAWPMALVRAKRVSVSIALEGGVHLRKLPFDSRRTSDPGVQIRSGYTAVSTAGTTIDSGSLGRFALRVIDSDLPAMWQQYTAKVASLIGRRLGLDNSVLPQLVSNEPVLLLPGETLIVSSHWANSSSVSHWRSFVQVCWEEIAYETFPIGGTVRQGNEPVSGAKVLVVQSNDRQFREVWLREIVTTNEQGQWSSSIRQGCVGGAWVQHEVDGQLFTAAGHPFLEDA